MRPRTTVAVMLMLALGAAAFAPLPFPRPKRPGATSLESMQGLWRVALRETAAGKAETRESQAFIEIRSGRWRYLDPDGESNGRTYTLKVQDARSPTWFDLSSRSADSKKSKKGRGPGGPGGGFGGRGAGGDLVGLVEVAGDRMKLVYSSRGERPKALKPERSGDTLLLLERVGTK